MAFTARTDKPCSHCNTVIPEGTNAGFTWDRLGGGYIHLDCLRNKKIAALGAPAGEEFCERCDCSKTIHLQAELYCPTGNTLKTFKLKNSGDQKMPTAENPVPVVAMNKSEAAHALAQMLGHLMTPEKSGMLTEEQTRAVVADEAKKIFAEIKTIEIKVAVHEPVKFDLAHKDLELLVWLVSVYNAAGHRQNIYMHGPAGSGKSTAARQASEALKLPYGYISLNPQTPDSRLLGYMHAGGEYVASEFFKRYTEGGVFCIDEIDNAAASLVTTLNGLLENGHGAFPHGVFQRHRDFVCVCTANTIGRGGDINYPERRQLDGAFLERFLFLLWDYDHTLTKAIVKGILDDKHLPFMKWVEQEASELKARFPTLIVSPRAHIQGATLKKLGMSDAQIKAMVIARGLK